MKQKAKIYSISNHDEQFYIGHFGNESGVKLSDKQRKLREWHLHPDSEQLFINIRLGGQAALRKAVLQNVELYFYPDENGEIFVNAQWFIDKRIMGDKETIKLQQLQNKIIEMKNQNNKE